MRERRGRFIGRAVSSRWSRVLALAILPLLFAASPYLRQVAYGASTSGRVQISVTVQVPGQPDMQIGALGDGGYVGDRVYDPSGDSQAKAQESAGGATITYLLRLRNDRIIADSFTVTGLPTGPGWRARYYDAETGGTDITDAVTGSGWRVPSLASAGDRLFRLEMTPDATVAQGGTAAVLIAAASEGDPAHKDAVKATATAVAGPPVGLTLTSSSSDLLADGKSTATLSATLTDGLGKPVADGTTVTFAADKGTVPDSAQTQAGTATATYTTPLLTATATATVTAHCGSVTQSLSLTLAVPASITGSIKVPPSTDGTPGPPIANALLEFYQDGKLVSNATGGPDGSLALLVRPGTYDIVVRAGGYVPIIIRGVELQAIPSGTDPSAPAGLALNVFTVPQPQFPRPMSMVTFPFVFTDGRPEAVIGGQSAQFRYWSRTAHDYVAPGGAEFPPVAAGTGFWLWRGDTPVLVSEPGEVPDQATPRRIPLGAGWNLIGNSFLRDVTLADIKVAATAGGQPLDLFSPEATALCGDFLWGFDPAGNQYVLLWSGGERQTLAVWNAYWILALQDCELVILPPATRAAEGLQARAQRVPRNSSGWRAKLVAVSGGVRDDENAFGVEDKASRIGSPPPLRGGVDLSFLPCTRAEEESGTTGLAHDIRAAGGSDLTWRFQVRSDVAGRDVTLQWPDLSRVPRSLRLLMVDEATGTKREMRTTGGYTFSPDPETTRRFRIEAVPNSGSTLRITDIQVRDARQSGKAIQYSLSASAFVTVELLSPAGRRVRTLVDRQAQSSGRNQVSFDGLDGRGVHLPAGIYVLQITAATETGLSVRAVQPVGIFR